MSHAAAGWQGAVHCRSCDGAALATAWYARRMSDKDRLIVGLGGEVVALDVRTGAEVWRNQMPGGGTGVVELLVGKGLVIATAWGAAIHAIDYESGLTLWRAPHPASGGRATMLFEGDALYVAKSGQVARFTLGGELLWNAKLRGLGTGSAAMGFSGNARQADSTGE